MFDARSEVLNGFIRSRKLVVAHARSCNVVRGRRGYLRSSEGIKTLVRVANEGQAHFSSHVLASLCSLSTEGGAVVVLVDFVNGEVLCVDVRLQLGLKRRADAAQTVPLHATEEGMLLDFVGAMGTTMAAQTMLGIADQARAMLATTRLVWNHAIELTA